MEKEFLNRLTESCKINNIDMDKFCDEEIQLTYNGITFDLQYFMSYDNKLEVPLTIVSMLIKGKEYRYEEYDFVDIDYSSSYDTVEEAIIEVMDAILNCDARRKIVKIINSFDSYIEDMTEKDLKILMSYIKNTYDD